MRRHRYLWCDGIEPHEYRLEGRRPEVRGRALIYGSEHAGPWCLRLLLAGPVESRGAIDWARLLPPDDVTRWLSFDEHERWIEIDPGAAVPDLA